MLALEVFFTILTSVATAVNLLNTKGRVLFIGMALLEGGDYYRKYGRYLHFPEKPP